MDGTDVEIEEYEEIVGNWDQASVREGLKEPRISERSQSKTPQLMNNLILWHTPSDRPWLLRPTERSFAGEQNESHTVVVKNLMSFWIRADV